MPSIRQLPLVLALTLPAVQALAQPRPSPQTVRPARTASGTELRLGIGPYAGATLSRHRSDVTPLDYTTLPTGAFDGSSCNCEFGDGTGVGATFGVKLMAPVGSFGWFTPRFLYEDRSASFATVSILADPNNASTGALKIPTSLDVGMTVMTLDLLAAASLRVLDAYVAVGPSFSYVATADYTMINGDRASGNGEYNGEFQDVRAVTYDLRAGLGFSIPVSRRVSINPEALYSYPLTKVSRWRDWSLRSFQATIGILISL